MRANSLRSTTTLDIDVGECVHFCLCALCSNRKRRCSQVSVVCGSSIPVRRRRRNCDSEYASLLERYYSICHLKNNLTTSEGI